MILSPKMIFVLLFILFIAGCGLNNESLGPTEEQKEEIAQRIAPIGTIVMFGDTSSVVEESISMDIQKVSLSPGPEHTVKMLNAGVDGSMVFEPAVLKVSKGDTIHFKAVDLSHNSASIEGMIPAGASPWAGAMNQDISITLDIDGIYVYQCDPHTMMAMVGVIQVGEPTNLTEINALASDQKSSFIMNENRLSTYLSKL
jgi:pseudoazurin